MTDLVILVPSRGRPKNVRRLIAACRETCRTDALIAFGFDDDDPCLQDCLASLSWKSTASVRKRMGLAPWTNELARLHDDGMAPPGHPLDSQLKQGRVSCGT